MFTFQMPLNPGRLLFTCHAFRPLEGELTAAFF
jgi:hypothetical protein